jgi:hypothetical protein
MVGIVHNTFALRCPRKLLAIFALEPIALSVRTNARLLYEVRTRTPRYLPNYVKRPLGGLVVVYAK